MALIKYCLLFITLTLITNTLWANNSKVVRDLRSRTAIKVEKEFIKNLELFGEIELGMEKNMSKLGKIHGETGLSYQPFKELEIEGKYRFTKNRKNYSEEFKYTHTFAAAVEGRIKIDLFKLYARLQYQNIDDDALDPQSDKDLRNILKPRIKIRYDIWGTKFSPYILSEMYFIPSQGTLFSSKIKNIVGLEYKINKKSELKLFYRNDHELSSYFPYTYNTLGVSITLSY
jgi:hypothetical protein